jgi:hypothetical protein
MYLNHKETIEMLDKALEIIAVSMANCEFYASIFADALNRQFTAPEASASWEKQLETALPQFYAAILVFSIKVRGYITPSSIGEYDDILAYKADRYILRSDHKSFEAVSSEFTTLPGANRREGKDFEETCHHGHHGRCQR